MRRSLARSDTIRAGLYQRVSRIASAGCSTVGSELVGGELDRACASAGEAAETLGLVGYAHGAWWLREFRRSVERWARSVPVRALDEQVAVL